MQEHTQEGFNALPIIMPLVGVLIGGGITFGYQSYFRWRDRERTKRERLLRFHRTTQLAMIDVWNIHNQFLSNLHDNYDGPIWGRLLPMYGINSNPVSYDLNDVSVVTSHQYEDTVARVWEILESRNAIMATLERFNELRTEFEDAIAPYTRIKNGVTETNMGFRDDPKLRMIEVRIESLGKSLVDRLRGSVKHIYEHVDAYNVMIREVEGKNGKLKIGLPKRD